jgi:sensor c-di-GMP phosphodiesterase-like protein
MSKKTIAEFVGDANTVRLLRICGVDCVQGYYISPPRPVSEVLEVESHNSADFPVRESLLCLSAADDPWHIGADL